MQVPECESKVMEGTLKRRFCLKLREWYGRDIMKGAPYKQEEK